MPPTLPVPLYLLGERYRQGRAVQRNRRKSQLAVLEKFSLSETGKGEGRVLFILGSGESVLSLQESQWSYVSGQASIGIGAWTLHPFVPDFLALEHIEYSPERDGYSESETGLERSYREALEGWYTRSEVQKRQPRILFFRPPKIGDLSRLAPLGDYWAEHTLLYGRISSSSRTMSGLERELKHYLRLVKAGIIPFFLPFDTGASLIRLICLGALSGYRNIVLAGVDLRDSRFFWEADHSFLAERRVSRFITSENGVMHSTETMGALPVSDSLRVVSRTLSQSLGTKLTVAHSSSWVASFLPVFDWARVS